MKTKLLIKGLALTSMLAGGVQAGAATFDLCTGEKVLAMPDGTNVTMWAYGIEDNTPTCTSATIPGPQLDVPVNDANLTINLRNTLSEPTSIMIPSLSSPTPPQPVFFQDGDLRQRARSMTHEAAANGGTAIYTFNASPGTHLYQSGSHPAVQVQMGLYGGVINNAAAGQAYTGIPYDNELVLLYSEIDPALHTAVQNGTYGSPAYPSTIDYQPKYFLVNGAPYTNLTPDLIAGSANQTTLIRFLNAGLKSNVPTLHDSSMELIAESGNAYPYSREQYSFLLAPSQTRDALFKPTVGKRYPLYDSRLKLTNNMQTEGGLMSFLSVASDPGTPTANPDSDTTNEDTAITALDLATNDTDPDGTIDGTTIHIPFPPANGMAVSNGNGTVTYTPNQDFNGIDTFDYTIKDDAGNVSNLAQVTVTVNAVNDAPVAADDAYTINQGVPLNVAAPGVLANDSDVDLDNLTATLQTNVSGGTLAFNSDGSFNYNPTSGTVSDSFTYVANDGTVDSNIATVNITIDSQLGAAVLISPTGTIATNTPTYTWNAVAGSTWYNLWVDDANGNAIQAWYTAAQANCDAGQATCSVTPVTALAAGAGTWWIQTYNSFGNGPWSDPMNFYVGSPPAAATLDQPSGVTNTNTPTFIWNAVADSTWYYLWVDDANGNAIKQWYTAAQANCGNGELQCSILSPVALADGDATWWIQTWNIAGTGPWSAGNDFFIGTPPPAATLILPEGNIVDSTPTYRWNSTPNTSWYYLWVDDPTGTVVKQWYTADQVGCGNGEAICQITPTTVLTSGNGLWWIQTWNSAGFGPWSASKAFTLQ